MHWDEACIEQKHGPAVLHFDARWLNEKYFHAVVQTARAGAGPDTVHKRLHMWDRAVLKSKRNLFRAAITDENKARQRELSMEIEICL